MRGSSIGSEIAPRHVAHVPSGDGLVRDSTRLVLLDGFDLRLDGQQALIPMGAQRLLAFLSLHERPLLRTYVAGALWTDSSERHAGASLRTALWQLGRLGRHLVEASKSHLRLSVSVAVDLREVMATAWRLVRPVVPEGGGIDAAIFSHDLLPDWYEDWVVLERERFRQLRLHALEALCRWLSLVGRHADAVQAGLVAVSGEPLRETAHRTLIEAHLAEGNLVEARRQYEWFRRLLIQELGAEPSDGLARLVGR
jgi:DNA-binding SARP family transcriptional activator